MPPTSSERSELPAKPGRSPTSPSATSYFFSHLACATCHIPPAASQSVLVVYFEKSPEVPLGLAEGEVDEPPDAPGAVVAPPLPDMPDPDDPPVVPDEPPVVPDEPPDVPDGLLPLEPPDVPPLPVCAAASAGARATIATKRANMSFCIVTSSIVGLTLGCFRGALLHRAISGPSN
jgi:hypothetical protein